ncbi:helix-turn-helix domain-containing protein [Streptomyces sp. NPDC096176]|uniref:helix-turn-helix domain-containing protein n=1 Tax=Streptomyces sp. NPDC096176 TaxID=3366079 RepID=UPI0037F2688D
MSRTPHTHRAVLASLLTALRESAGLTYAALAARTARMSVSATTLKRAAGGIDVPQEATVTTFLRGCDADAFTEQVLMAAWRAARAEQRGRLASLHAPAVENIRTPADLSAALAAAYEEAGAPPLRVLQERAGIEGTAGSSLLPMTTAWRITCRKARRPTDWRQCEAFLRGCGITGPRLNPWRQAWDRAQSHTMRSPEATAAIERRLLNGARARRVAEPLQRLLAALPTDAAKDVVDHAIRDAAAMLAARNGAPPPTNLHDRMLLLPQEGRPAPYDTGVDFIRIDGRMTEVMEAKRFGRSDPPPAAVTAQPGPTPGPRITAEQGSTGNPPPHTAVHTVSVGGGKTHAAMSLLPFIVRNSTPTSSAEPAQRNGPALKPPHTSGSRPQPPSAAAPGTASGRPGRGGNTALRPERRRGQ